MPVGPCHTIRPEHAICNGAAVQHCNMQQIYPPPPGGNQDVTYVVTVNYIDNRACTLPGMPVDVSGVMKVAIPYWQGRVSPVFDSATRVVLVDVADGEGSARTDLPLTATDPALRVRELSAGGTDVVICGAISWPMESVLSSAGIQVIAQICGYVEEVLRAYLEGRLADPAFRMPGCCGRRRRFQGRRRHGRGRQEGGAAAGRWRPAAGDEGHGSVS
jgi:predicted Fe-Mo cluster-binding NifX family protein